MPQRRTPNDLWHFSAGRRMVSPMHRNFDPEDYAVVVKLRANPPTPWRWEIYCAGKRLPIEQSDVCFASRGAAHTAGKEALARLLDRLLHPSAESERPARSAPAFS